MADNSIIPKGVDLEECPKNIKEATSPVIMGLHDFDVMVKFKGRRPESRSGAALIDVFLSVCKHCGKMKVEFFDGL